MGASARRRPRVWLSVACSVAACRAAAPAHAAQGQVHPARSIVDKGPHAELTKRTDAYLKDTTFDAAVGPPSATRLRRRERP